jgi:uncharacterized protein
MIWLLGTVFLASLLGSLHCVGMCGPFALLAGGHRAGEVDTRSRSAWSAALFYNFGRLITYACVGILFGAAGMAVNKLSGDFGSSISFWQQSATWIAGSLMIGVGLVGVARFYGWRVRLPNIVRPLQKVLQELFRRTKHLTRHRRALVIGMLTSLMPCGWLYAFAITAAGTGSPFYGMLVMIVFWLGSVPVLLALIPGVNLLQRFGKSTQRQLPLIMSSLVILTGMFTLVHRAPVMAIQQSSVVSGLEPLQQQLTDFDQSELPCCKNGNDK